MELSNKIVELRKRNGISQLELAVKLGVSSELINKWETGISSPDLESVKKLAKVFSISFDVLLDDDNGIGETPHSMNDSKNTTKELKTSSLFRKVFNSGIVLDSVDQADYENGYTKGIKKIEGKPFVEASSKHKRLIDKKGYSKTIMVQHDLLVEFFIDDKNKCFGFFFDGAPQFVCPFENFAAFSVTDNGLSTSFTKKPVIGVGFGNNSSLTVGSTVAGQIRHPMSYDCFISYFDDNGLLQNYKITFRCYRNYIIYNNTIRSREEALFWNDLLSESTNKKLGEVSAYLNGIKEAGTQIKNGLIKVEPLDLTSLSEEVNAGQEQKKTVYRSYDSIKEESQKRKKKTLMVTLIVAASVVLASIAGVFISVVISGAIAANQTAQVNRAEAQKVIDLIDAIGDVSLSSRSKITKAENAYEALTDDQKALVSNYSKLVEARDKYEEPLDEEREEATKDDPTRTIVVADLVGRWTSSSDEWLISDIQGALSVLCWTSTGANPDPVAEKCESSYLVGYNNRTRRMEIKLFHYTAKGGEWLDVEMKKSSTDSLSLFYLETMFHKTAQE